LLADYPEALATRARALAQLGDLAGALQARSALAGLAATGDAGAQRLLSDLREIEARGTQPR